MPRFDFKCRKGHLWEEVVAEGRRVRCPECGMTGKKQFSPTANFLIPFWMTAEADRKNSGRQKAWIDKPETQAKLKTGEYDFISKSDDRNHM